MNCRVCSSPLDAWAVKEGVPLARCPGCGSIHADSVKVSTDLYAELYDRPLVVPAVVETALRRLVRSMSPFRTHGKWLDIGFGQGALLNAAALEGWVCCGTEQSRIATAKAQALGFTTAPGTEAFGYGTFDVVSLVEFLEHVDSPRDFLLEARRVLRRGGCLYLTTPNAWSLNRWILGASWTVFAPPDHVTIFTPPALRRLLEESGFERMSIRAEGLNPFELLRAAQPTKRSTGFDRTGTSTRLCETLSSSPARRGFKATANAILNSLRIGDSLKVRAR